MDAKIAKSWSAMQKLDKIWETDLTQKLEIQFYQVTNKTDTVWCQNLDSNKENIKSTGWILHLTT